MYSERVRYWIFEINAISRILYKICLNGLETERFVVSVKSDNAFTIIYKHHTRARIMEFDITNKHNNILYYASSHWKKVEKWTIIPLFRDKKKNSDFGQKPLPQSSPHDVLCSQYTVLPSPDILYREKGRYIRLW